MEYNESSEDYLEAILVLSKDGNVRAIDVAKKLRFSKPSVSIALKKMLTKGYISYDNDGYIVLTQSGKEVADNVYAKHQLLSELLISLGVDENIAKVDACKLEHSLSDESYVRIKQFVEERKK